MYNEVTLILHFLQQQKTVELKQALALSIKICLKGFFRFFHKKTIHEKLALMFMGWLKNMH